MNPAASHLVMQPGRHRAASDNVLDILLQRLVGLDSHQRTRSGDGLVVLITNEPFSTK